MIPEQNTPVSGPKWEIIKQSAWPWRGWWVLRSVPTSSDGSFAVYECTWVARCWTRRGAVRWYEREVSARR